MNNTVILGIYVDDGILTGSNSEEMECIIKKLREEFKIKDKFKIN